MFISFILFGVFNSEFFWGVAFLAVIFLIVLIRSSKSIKGGSPFIINKDPHAEAEISEMRDEKISGDDGPTGPGNQAA
jgi:hypothetical protein